MNITPIIQWELESIVSWGTETIRVEEGDYIEVEFNNCDLVYTGYVHSLDLRKMCLKEIPGEITTTLYIKDIKNIKIIRKVYIKY